MARPVHYATSSVTKSLAFGPVEAFVPGPVLVPCQYNGTQRRMIVTTNAELVTCKRCRKLANLGETPAR